LPKSGGSLVARRRAAAGAGDDLAAHGERSKFVKIGRIPEAGSGQRNVDPGDAINSKTPLDKLFGSITPSEVHYERSHSGVPDQMTTRFTRTAICALIAVTWLWGVHAMAADGLITLRSSFGPEETMKRFEAEVRAKGMTVFAHIDHAAGAAGAGLPLRPTDLLIFGAAKGGTPLMQSVQSIGIDLPLKALVWQEDSGTTWLSYNDPAYLAHRHGLGESARSVTDAMSGALKAIASKAITPP
jgi:uncharacterized protein (DUF302 family)